MGRKCTYDDSHLRKAVVHPQEFPYKSQILRIFEKYGYFNEDIAFRVSKIRMWDDDAQQARYNRLADIVSLIPYFSSSDDCKKIANSPLDKDSVKAFIGASAEYYLNIELGKWHSENYVNLCSYLREKNVFDGPRMPILQKDGSIAFYSGGGLRRISKAEYEAYIADLKAGHTRKSPFSEDEWFFLMDTFIIEQNGEGYSYYNNINPNAFMTAVERAYNYIVEHAEDIRKDEVLLSRTLSFTTTRMVDMILYGKLRSILCQVNITAAQACRQINDAVDVSFFFHRLPWLLAEYQEWELLHKGEHTTYMGKVKSTLIQWRGDEFSHVSKYFVAQHLYFVLTGELVAKDGKVPMPIACVIDELMRLFGYLEDIDWESQYNGIQNQYGNELSNNRIDADIRKRRLDCVKRFFLVDPITKEYRRLR